MENKEIIDKLSKQIDNSDNRNPDYNEGWNAAIGTRVLDKSSIR